MDRQWPFNIYCGCFRCYRWLVPFGLRDTARKCLVTKLLPKHAPKNDTIGELGPTFVTCEHYVLSVTSATVVLMSGPVKVSRVIKNYCRKMAAPSPRKRLAYAGGAKCSDVVSGS